MKKEKMANVLLVEDDKRQIKWAKKSLKNCNLKIVSSYMEFGIYTNPIFQNKIDYVITDLTVPYEKGMTSEAIFGLKIYKELFEAMIFNPRYIKGLALVSDFDNHHQYNNFNFLEQELIGLTKMVSSAFGKKLDIYRGDIEEFCIGKVLARPKNIIFFYDCMCFNDYKYFMSPKGVITAKNEMPKFFREKTDFPIKDRLGNNGYIKLKPFEEILAALQNKLLIKNRIKNLGR